MPVSDVNTWRSAQYNFKGYLFLLSPKVVWSGTVAAPTSWPALSLTVLSTISGSLSNANVDQTVVFGLAPHGTDQGFSRVRLASGGSTLYIGKSAQGAGRYGDLNLLSDCYAEVWDDYRVWAKIPYIDPSGNEFKDGDISAGTYPSSHVPIAQSGVGYAQFVDPFTNVITVPFVGGYLLDNLASSSSILWDIVDGTLASGSLTSFNMTATFPPGFRWVRLIVTVNGNTDIAVVPVFAAERTGVNAPITNFRVMNGSKLYADRHEIDFQINYPLPVATYPYGTLAMMWEDEWYNGAKGSLYNSDAPLGREHMKFIGWVDEEPNARKSTKTGGTDSVTLNCIDAAGRLKKLPGFSQTLTYSLNPTTWYQWYSLTIDSYLASLVYWQTTVTKVASFMWSGIFYPVTNLISDGKQDFHSQFDKLSGAICYALTTDQWGRLTINPDPNLQLSRTSIVQIALNDNDYSNPTFTATPYPKVAWLHSSAIIASNSAVVPVFCDAPGLSPGQGPNDQTIGNRLVQNLFELLIQEGHRYAKLNAPIGPITIPLIRPGDVGINPGFMTWITLNAAAFLRGFNISGNRLLPIERDTTYTYSKIGVTKKVSVKAIIETVGLPAVQYTPPTNNLPSTQPPQIVNPVNPLLPPISIRPGKGAGPTAPNPGLLKVPSDGNAAIWIRGNKVYRSSDFVTGNATAKDITPTGAFTFTSIALNPVVTSKVGLYILGNDGANSYVWYTANAFAATVIWSKGAAIAGVYQDVRLTSAPGTIAIYSIAAGGSAIDYDANYWLSKPYDVSINGAYTNTNIAQYVTNHTDAYPGAVGVKVNATITISPSYYGNTFFSYDGIGWSGSAVGFSSYDTSPVTLTDVLSNTSAVYSHFPGYRTLGQQTPSDLQSGTPTLRWELLSGNGGAHVTITSTITARIIVDKSIQPLPSGVTVVVSASNGATWGAPLPVGATPSGSEGGFDVLALASSSVAASALQANYATTAGGAYTPDPHGVTSSDPLCILALWYRFGSTVSLNYPGVPDYLIITATQLLKVAAGLAAVDITPVISAVTATGIASNNAICTWYGKTFYVIMALSGTTHVLKTTNSGATWTDCGAFPNAVYIRLRRVGGSGIQLYVAHGTAISYSNNGGASWTTISLIGSGNVTAVEVYG